MAGGLNPRVALAAAKILAATAGRDLSTWLAGEVSSDDPRRVQRALDAAGRAFLTQLLPACRRALASSNHELRVIAAEAFGGFDAGYRDNLEFRLDDGTLNDLWSIVRDDPHDDLRDAAAHSLAMWGDERCLSHWKAKLHSRNWKERNSGVVNIRQFAVVVRYKRKMEFNFTDLLDTMDTLAQSDPNDNVRVHAALVLIEAQHRRAAASITRLLEAGGQYGRRMAAGFVPLVAKFLDETERQQVADALAAGLREDDPDAKAWCRRGLLDLLDERGNSWGFGTISTKQEGNPTSAGTCSKVCESGKPRKSVSPSFGIALTIPIRRCEPRQHRWPARRRSTRLGTIWCL